MRTYRWLLAACLLQAASGAVAQAVLPTALSRMDGMDADSKLPYVLITVEGKLADAAAPQPSSPPRLTAQCYRDYAGKLKFELLMDLGGGGPLAFYPPWKATKDSLYPPSLTRQNVTMEFLGYTKVKPVKRQWASVAEMPGEMKYATPGMQSSNMEEIAFYLQYLRALPTFRLTVPGRPAAVFETLQWQDRVRAEPLCKASGL